MRRKSATIGLFVSLAVPCVLSANPAAADIGQTIEQARLAEARVHLADSRGGPSSAHEDLARLNQALAGELTADLAAGRVTGLEAFAKAVEADKPAGRGAFAGAWSQVKANLRDTGLRARLAKQASRLQWLEWRIEAAMNAPGVQVPARRTALPIDARPALSYAPASRAVTTVGTPPPVAPPQAPDPAPTPPPPRPQAMTSAHVASASLTYTPEVRTVPAPPANASVTIPGVEDTSDAPGVNGSYSIGGSGPTLVVADFTENGYRTGAALAASDLLARALADSGRFHVIRATGGSPASAPGVLVQAEISPIRVFSSPTPYFASSGVGFFGSGRRYSRRYYPYPYAYANDVSYALDAHVRVSDLSNRVAIAEKTVSGWTTTYQNSGYPGVGLGGLYGYGSPGFTVSAGGPAAQVVEQAMLDKRTGAARLVLDLVPLTGRVTRVENPRSAVVEVPVAGGVHPGDRFVILGGAGQEVAVLRAQDRLTPTALRVKVSGRDDDDPPPPVQPGDSIVSRGY